MNNLELPGLVAAFADASEGMLAAILDQSADCIKVIGENGTVDYMNRNGQCAMEVEDFCAIAGQPWTALWPAEAGPMILDAMAKARAGEAARFATGTRPTWRPRYSTPWSSARESTPPRSRT